ncbi:cell growth-regulating nucleolar protein [Dendroctonus ponderosae]|uniref:Uncharacterized protein n=1 Tax=Dendroctonus ponderosae TaxID=77166 RepID=U4U753_DENPD|nr:cell growth-regulating nucleolar protein [Dendroctonus ponderosae]ERL88178.1 hypothetical protein D910_05566 [Dendroctonus ponderosae]KAH1010054.1 hypothetical protein HUJ05_004414 [Dendroctonus ponderosae]
MVVFTCNHCGESLHKPKVEKHYQFQCRNYKSMTCVDCFKDFKNEEYSVHTKCITEDERYAAKGTYKNGIVKKGEVKQESWLDMIRSICETEKNLKPSIKHLLETISEYTNVPRKKQKFMNFIKSSSGNRVSMQEVEQIWDIIEKHKNASTAQPKEQPQQETLNNKRSSENEDPPSKKQKKNGNSAPEESQQTVNEPDSGKPKFDYALKILEILQEKQSISHKKLQKKILKAYRGATGQSDCEEKVIKKLNRKLKKIPNVVIEQDTVSLLS